MPHPAPHLRAHAPLLSAAGYAFLRQMTEHPHAPPWNYPCGDRLRDGDVVRVDRFRDRLVEGRTAREGDTPPLALLAWVLERRAMTPRFRAVIPDGVASPDALARHWAAIPTTGRHDLATDLTALVPDDADLDRMVVYATSGTTGHPIQIPSDPVSAACYLPLLELSLRLHGAPLDPQPGQMANALLCAQRHTVTYASVLTPWREAGHVKVNLDAAAWHAPGDAAAYLAHFAPPLLTGDPFSFAAAMRLDPGYTPAALVSTAVALSDGLRDRLRVHFGCPVIDWYSLNETGPLAVACPLGHGHHVLPHDVFVEVVDDDGAPVAAGVRGEVVVTGGRNPFLPLLRYRTGDHAALDAAPCPCGDPMPRLVGLEGRAPVHFEAADGTPVNPVDVSRVLRPFPLVRHRLVQHADRTCTLTLQGLGAGPSPVAVEAALRGLFGEVGLRIEGAPGGWAEEGKGVPYESALQPGGA